MDPSPNPAAPAFPKVPGYAWAWLQRSRPVLTEAAARLTGAPPTAAFVEELRVLVPTDAFTRDVLLGVIADVAFNGRIPARRPPGTTWDRGLVWWAAVLAGTSVADFDARTDVPAQRPLFPSEAADGEPPAQAAPVRRSAAPAVAWPRPAGAGGPRPSSPERLALVRALRDLLATAEGGAVPVSAIQQLLAELEQ